MALDGIHVILEGLVATRGPRTWSPGPIIEYIGPHTWQIVSSSIFVKGWMCDLDVYGFLDLMLKPFGFYFQTFGVIHRYTVIWVVQMYMARYFRCDRARPPTFSETLF